MPGKNRPNRGWFRRGFDPRRHKLTRAERVKGGENTVRRHYMGGGYAAYLGQAGQYKDVTLAELAALCGDGDRPGLGVGQGGAD